MKSLKKCDFYDKIIAYLRVIFMINYALKIKEYRERKFLTQAELATLLGVGKTTITRWETGQFNPTIKTKKKLYELFIEAGINVEEN